MQYQSTLAWIAGAVHLPYAVREARVKHGEAVEGCWHPSDQLGQLQTFARLVGAPVVEHTRLHDDGLTTRVLALVPVCRDAQMGGGGRGCVLGAAKKGDAVWGARVRGSDTTVPERIVKRRSDSPPGTKHAARGWWWETGLVRLGRTTFLTSCQ